MALLWLPAGVVPTGVVHFGADGGPAAAPAMWLGTVPMLAGSLVPVAPCGLPLALRVWGWRPLLGEGRLHRKAGGSVYRWVVRLGSFGAHGGRCDRGPFVLRVAEFGVQLVAQSFRVTDDLCDERVGTWTFMSSSKMSSGCCLLMSRYLGVCKKGIQSFGRTWVLHMYQNARNVLLLLVT